MARGRLLRTKVKEQQKLQEAKQKTEWKLKQQKPLMVSLREYLETAAARIDPLELGAVLSATFIIEPAVEKLVEIGAFESSVLNTDVAALKWFWTGMNQEQLKQDIMAGVIPKDKVDEMLALPQAKIGLYMVSFVIAFCIIRWGDKLLEGGLGNLMGIGKLLGVAA